MERNIINTSKTDNTIGLKPWEKPTINPLAEINIESGSGAHPEGTGGNLHFGS